MIPRHKRLQHRLALHVGVGLLFLCCVLGGLTYTLSFERELEAATTLEAQLVQTVRAQAEVAVFARNRKIADEVITGLRANANIAAVTIVGEGLPPTETESQTPSSRMAQPTFGQATVPRTEYPLYSPIDGEQRIGTLVVLRNAEEIAQKANRTAIYQAAVMLVQLLATVLLLVFTVQRLLGKPVADLAATLGSIHPGNAERVIVPERHAEDEIGSLAASANKLLAAVDSSLEKLNASNKRLSATLELLTEKELSKSRFFAAANHDLRQPVHAINLFLEHLERTAPRPDQAPQLDAIKHSTQTLTELLDSLLDISKLDAGAVMPSLEWVAAEDVFQRLDSDFSSIALRQDLRFKFWFPHEGVQIYTDRRLLLTILSNLLGNALKYTQHGGVLIALRKRSRGFQLGNGGTGAWAFQIWDTGIGIADEHLNRIYDEFYQINNSGRNRAKGLGMGLAIVRRTTDLLGYRLICVSRLGRGTRFELELPPSAVRVGEVAYDRAIARNGKSISQDAERDSASLEADFFGKSFVVLEDDPLVAEGLKTWLQSLGCLVTLFACGEDALQSDVVEATDYFVVDEQLEGTLTGQETLTRLQSRQSAPLRAVLVTGNTRSSFVGESAQADWPVLFKPVKGQQILQALKKSGAVSGE